MYKIHCVFAGWKICENIWNNPRSNAFTYLLDPFENRQNFPRILVDNSTEAFRKNSRYVVGKTTSCDMGYALYASFANQIKYLFSKDKGI